MLRFYIHPHPNPGRADGRHLPTPSQVDEAASLAKKADAVMVIHALMKQEDPFFSSLGPQWIT
jgi:hypothetical protein